MVLFDGTTADNFEHGTLLPEQELAVRGHEQAEVRRLHAAPRVPPVVHAVARGQARSNSGVYLHDCYEIQVLDSFGLEGEDNECGGFYNCASRT